MQTSILRPVQIAGLRQAFGQRRAWIALTGLILGFGLVSAFGADASPDLHTFTNQDGRTIQAEISSAAEDFVYLKRADGQSFKVGASTLSKDDQNFIRQWVIKQAKLNGDDVLTFGAASVRSNPANPTVTTKTAVTTTWSESYKIKVTNATPVHWTNLQLHYIIFRLAGVPGALPPNNFTPTTTAGKVALDDLPGERDQTVATDKIDLKEVSLPPGTTYANGAPVKVTDTLQGVWVRVYDENNNLLQEWSYPHDLTKDKNWDALTAPVGRGGRRGGGAAKPRPTS